MITTAMLAGKLAAHGIWSVSEGATLIPMLGWSREGEPMQLVRLAFSDLRDAALEGRKQLDENPSDADDGVLVYDVMLTLDGRKIDALAIEMRCYGSPSSRATVAVPYTPAGSGRFAVHKPKLLEWTSCDDFDVHAMFDAFWAGVDSHEEGAKLWNAALDQSF